MNNKIITTISSKLKQLSISLFSINLPFLFIIMFTVPCDGIESVDSVMKKTLKSLEYNFSQTTMSKKRFFVIPSEKNTVFITEDAVRDINKNTVNYYLFTTWPSLFLSENDLKGIYNINLKSKSGTYEIIEDGKRVRILYSIALPKVFSQTELSKAIRECAEVKFPVTINPNEQNRLSIKEALNEVIEAIKAGGGEEKIAQRMSKINFKYCPKDFFNAMEQFYHAWTSRLGAAEAGAALADDPLSAFILIGYGTLVDTAFQSEEIKKSFQAVLRVAQKYGVDTENYRL